jgi:hypothetical protein
MFYQQEREQGVNCIICKERIFFGAAGIFLLCKSKRYVNECPELMSSGIVKEDYIKINSASRPTLFCACCRWNFLQQKLSEIGHLHTPWVGQVMLCEYLPCFGVYQK